MLHVWTKYIRLGTELLLHNKNESQKVPRKTNDKMIKSFTWYVFTKCFSLPCQLAWTLDRWWSHFTSLLFIFYRQHGIWHIFSWWDEKKFIFELPKKIITRWAKARFVIQPFELVHFLVKKASKFFFLSTFKIFFEHTLSVGGYFFLNHITNTLSDIVRNVTLSVSPILQLWMNTCRRTKEYGKRLNNLHAYYPCMHTCWSYGRLISLVHYASSKFFSFEHFFSSRFSNTVTTKFT